MREPVNDPATVNQMQTRAEITEAVAQIRQLTNDCAALIERTPSAPDPATASNVRGALRQHISEAVDGAADAIEHLSNLMGGERTVGGAILIRVIVHQGRAGKAARIGLGVQAAPGEG